jgi:hypothetical protein
MVAPSKPDERSVRRGPSGVVINAAVPAIELRDGEVCACWSGSRKAERQRTNCEEDFLHSPKPLCCSLDAVANGAAERNLVMLQGSLQLRKLLLMRPKNKSLEVQAS